jgi:predicted GNAT family acetyltransferase
LSPADRQEVEAFYHRSHPGNWFDPRMLDTGQYFGVRFGGRLIAAGGVHVASHTYRVAALGNIATDPEHRGEGLATRVTARICVSLRESVEHIGLNVKADNAAAMACYRKLGFEVIGEYDELLFECGAHSPGR